MTLFSPLPLSSQSHTKSETPGYLTGEFTPCISSPPSPSLSCSDACVPQQLRPCLSVAGELKISTREQGLMVCQCTMAGNSITSCTDSGLLSAHSAVVVAPRQCQAPVCYCRVRPSVLPTGKPLLLTPPINMEGGYTFIEGSNGRLRDSYPEARAERQPITSCNGSPCVTDLTYISPLSFSQQPVTVLRSYFLRTIKRNAC